MHIDLKLGLSCNNSCRHCIMEPVRLNLTQDDKNIDSTFESIENLIDSFKSNDVNSVTLTGGEPTFRKDFFEILGKLARSNVEITVQTNGRLLGKENSIKLLSEIPCRDVLFVVAIHSGSSTIHDNITRASGSFEETTDSVRKLIKLGFPTCGKMVLSRYNVNDISSTVNYMYDLGMREAMVAYPHAEDFSPEVLNDVLPTYPEVKDSINNICLNPNFPIFFETIPYCNLPDPKFFKFSIDLTLLKHSLNDLKIIIEMSMTGQQINWNKSRLSMKVKGPRCDLCLLSYVCEGIWEESFKHFGGEYLVPIVDPSVINTFLDTF